MLTIIFPRDEDNVIQLTWENLQRELNSIVGSEIIIARNWVDGLAKAKTDYVCLVESDCIVSGGYFSSNLNLFKKNPYFRKLAMVSSCLGVENFGNRIYNYHVVKTFKDYVDEDKELKVSRQDVEPDRDKRSTELYPVQIGLLPGAIIRTEALRDALSNTKFQTNNLVKLSADVSFYFWGSGRRVYVNPNTTYVSTERYFENPPKFKLNMDKAGVVFDKEGI